MTIMLGITCTRNSVTVEQHPHWQTNPGSSAGTSVGIFCDMGVKLVCVSWGSGPKKHEEEFSIQFLLQIL